jgi:hypothetical protein
VKNDGLMFLALGMIASSQIKNSPNGIRLQAQARVRTKRYRWGKCFFFVGLATRPKHFIHDFTQLK